MDGELSNVSDVYVLTARSLAVQSIQALMAQGVQVSRLILEGSQVGKRG